jgi:RimJ/RimL family protein N-acetyltransferase
MRKYSEDFQQRNYTMRDFLPLYQRCSFNTERLLIKSVKSQILNEDSKRLFTLKVLELLTPAVTSSLPCEWQNISSYEEASNWWQQRIEESSFLSIQLKSSNEIIGFVFLYDDDSKQMQIELHIGYLLGEPYWAKGYGSELVKGLVNWAYLDKHIHSLIGGVEVDNIGSIKVMEKNGFNRSNQKSPDKNVMFLEYVIKGTN